MIEGVRLLPWYQEAVRARPGAMTYFTDCERCKKMNSVEQRQLMGCGFEPPVAHAQPWIPDGYERGRPPEDDPRGRRERDPEICVGYTVGLREVIEVSRARLHWDKGTLRDWCGDEPPTPGLMLCLEELECQISAVQAHAMEQARKGAKS